MNAAPKERPILMSAPMVRACLREVDPKTQTRRGIKPQPDWLPEVHSVLRTDGVFFPLSGEGRGHQCGAPIVSCPYGVPGDRLLPAMEIPSLGRNYCADVYGHIWSRARDGKTWRRLKGSPTSKGYLSVTPAVEGRYPTKHVHALVAEAFYGDRPEGLDQIRHLNGDQIDNAPENIDWGTHEDNWSDRLAHGRYAGAEHHSAKLTQNAVAEIRSSALSQRALARKFGVAQATIWEAIHGSTWAEMPTARPPNMPRWASRLTLEITDVRVERLNEISEADAVAEGLIWRPAIEAWAASADPNWPTFTDPVRAYRGLWEHINGPGSWAANPWVWVVVFKRAKDTPPA